MSTQETLKAAAGTDATSASAQLPQDATIKILLDRSGRPTRAVPIRRALLQQGTAGNRTPGPLHRMVRRSQERALDLLLLLSAVTSSGDYTVTEWSTTWARTVGLFSEQAGTQAVSRAWKVLEDLKLISRSRGKQGKTTITKLREDGSGDAYTPPGMETGDPYFSISFAYWEKGFHNKLSLPGKVMLLIASSQRKKEFKLPQDRMPSWYGISADTAMRGIAELIKADILAKVGEEWFDTLATKSGRASRPIYALQGDFEPRALGPQTTEAEAPTETPSAP